MAHRMKQEAGAGRTERTPSLTEQAYASIRGRIITCSMPPGVEVSEPMLADELGVSKTPVREALARLALEGYVDTLPRRGYRVRPISVKVVNDLFTVRGILEGAAAELAARAMSDAALDDLERLANATYRRDEAPSVDAFINANSDFHTAIANGSGVPRLANLIVAHLQEATRLFYMGANMRDVNPETNDDHRRIVGFLRAEDSEGARRAILRHNENTRHGLLSVLVGNENSGLLF